MVEDGPARYAAAAREWAERWAPEAEAPVFANPPLAGRRLRIGYVSPAFGATQVRQFITPILQAHDPEAVAVYLYPATGEHETAWPDHIAVRPIGHLADSDAAALIRDDAIDVLIDCWGHSAGSRLGVFARRAAPVQAAWINFVQTTGLKRMDYVLHADTMAAPGTAALFTETVLSMGEIIIPFTPRADRPPTAPTPALRLGRVTFGSFNHPAKLSDATVHAWSRILKRRPGSRLLLKYRYFVDPVLQSVTRARFAAERVDPGRIDFQGQSEGAEYLASYDQVDVFLDPSPCPGGTTTCDALAAGVPVLTLAGPDFYSRIGIQCLAASRAAGVDRRDPGTTTSRPPSPSPRTLPRSKPCGPASGTASTAAPTATPPASRDGSSRPCVGCSSVGRKREGRGLRPPDQTAQAVGGVMPAAPAGPAVPDNLLDAWGAGWPYRQAFSSARSAMAALLRDRCVRRVWTPAYVCPAVAEAIDAAGAAPCFYAVSNALEPDLAPIAARAQAGDAVLCVAFFGRPPSPAFAALRRERTDLLWIEDRAQAADPASPFERRRRDLQPA